MKQNETWTCVCGTANPKKHYQVVPAEHDDDELVVVSTFDNEADAAAAVSRESEPHRVIAVDNDCQDCGREQPHFGYLPYSGWVNVYLIDRAYGGPEEGGWWYETGQAIRSTQGCHIEALKAQEQAWCDAENKQRRSDIGSVLSEGKYVVRVENNPGEDFPKTRPHYE